MKLNREIIWTFFGMILVILSYVLLEQGNPQNKWNKVVLFGLFSSFFVRLVITLRNRKIDTKKDKTT
jgi:hypothetical protein